LFKKIAKGDVRLSAELGCMSFGAAAQHLPHVVDALDGTIMKRICTEQIFGY